MTAWSLPTLPTRPLLPGWRLPASPRPAAGRTPPTGTAPPPAQSGLCPAVAPRSDVLHADPPRTARVVPFALLPPELIVALPLAATALLAPGSRQLAALAAIILLGIPHGALDGEIARTALRPRFGRLWFGVFAAPYLTLSAVVLLCWSVAPLATLAGFLSLSVLHFGTEDAPGGDRLDLLFRGGAPIAPAVLLHPAATARLFGTVAGAPLDAPPAWLLGASLLWLLPAALWLRRTLSAPARRARSVPQALAEPALTLALFAALPPITAFAAYFVGIHAPHHVAALVADPVRAPRVASRASALRRAAPVTALTLLLGAVLWPAYAGPAPDRLLELTLQGLAALTVPHMLLDAWTGRRAACQHPGIAGKVEAPGHARGRVLGILDRFPGSA